MDIVVKVDGNLIGDQQQAIGSVKNLNIALSEGRQVIFSLLAGCYLLNAVADISVCRAIASLAKVIAGDRIELGEQVTVRSFVTSSVITDRPDDAQLDVDGALIISRSDDGLGLYFIANLPFTGHCKLSSSMAIILVEALNVMIDEIENEGALQVDEALEAHSTSRALGVPRLDLDDLDTGRKRR